MATAELADARSARLAYVFANLVGQDVVVTTHVAPSGRVAGMLISATEAEVMIQFPQQLNLKGKEAQLDQNAVTKFYMKDVAFIEAIDAHDSGDAGEGFSDAEIAASAGEFARGDLMATNESWLDPGFHDSDGGMLTGKTGTFDQFEAFRKRGGVESFDINLYSSVVDKSQITPEQLAFAERVGADIDAKEAKKIIRRGAAAAPGAVDIGADHWGDMALDAPETDIGGDEDEEGQFSAVSARGRHSGGVRGGHGGGGGAPMPAQVQAGRGAMRGGGVGHHGGPGAGGFRQGGGDGRDNRDRRDERDGGRGGGRVGGGHIMQHSPNPQPMHGGGGGYYDGPQGGPGRPQGQGQGHGGPRAFAVQGAAQAGTAAGWSNPRAGESRPGMAQPPHPAAGGVVQGGPPPQFEGRGQGQGSWRPVTGGGAAAGAPVPVPPTANAPVPERVWRQGAGPALPSQAPPPSSSQPVLSPAQAASPVAPPAASAPLPITAPAHIQPPGEAGAAVPAQEAKTKKVLGLRADASEWTPGGQRAAAQAQAEPAPASMQQGMGNQGMQYHQPFALQQPILYMPNNVPGMMYPDLQQNFAAQMYNQRMQMQQMFALQQQQAWSQQQQQQHQQQQYAVIPRGISAPQQQFIPQGPGGVLPFPVAMPLSSPVFTQPYSDSAGNSPFVPSNGAEAGAPGSGSQHDDVSGAGGVGGPPAVHSIAGEVPGDGGGGGGEMHAGHGGSEVAGEREGAPRHTPPHKGQQGIGNRQGGAQGRQGGGGQGRRQGQAGGQVAPPAVPEQARESTPTAMAAGRVAEEKNVKFSWSGIVAKTPAPVVPPTVPVSSSSGGAGAGVGSAIGTSSGASAQAASVPTGTHRPPAQAGASVSGSAAGQGGSVGAPRPSREGGGGSRPHGDTKHGPTGAQTGGAPAASAGTHEPRGRGAGVGASEKGKGAGAGK